MNINSVDLLGLKELVISENEISESNKRIIDRLFFSVVNHETMDADYIIVYGNPALLFDRCDSAIRLFEKSPNLNIILSGGALLPNSTISESEAMREYCIKKGIPSKSIVLENESLTTEENIKKCGELLKSLGKKDLTIISVSSLTHLRRIVMNMQKHKSLFPEGCTFLYMNSDNDFDVQTWIHNDKARKSIATELGFIHEYLYVLDYPSFDF